MCGIPIPIPNFPEFWPFFTFDSDFGSEKKFLYFRFRFRGKKRGSQVRKSVNFQVKWNSISFGGAAKVSHRDMREQHFLAEVLFSKICFLFCEIICCYLRKLACKIQSRIVKELENQV